MDKFKTSNKHFKIVNFFLFQNTHKLLNNLNIKKYLREGEKYK